MISTFNNNKEKNNMILRGIIPTPAVQMQAVRQRIIITGFQILQT